MSELVKLYMIVLTLNVCGIRASQKKGLFKWLSRIKADVICLQEVRATEEQIQSEDFMLPNYKRFLSEATKKLLIQRARIIKKANS